ncbi:hypothetical protein SDC9_109271 [bioreactor metagenome]|uniref:Peptidase S11 D-alanyl-D-alanine carboxypeptidase A N-terminal domain-containing protein n=1 Tax=bioreactor metagenome TaxID=1076179 RepID=A0A645BAA3_9ZZZZ
MPKILKNNWFDLIIIFLILVLNLFWLPSFSYWGTYGLDQSISKNQISQFKIPSPPIVKLASKPQTTAQNYILVDVITNKILASKNAQDKIYPASTTKLVTALTALNIYPLDETITINEEYLEGQNMGLKLGEKITVKSLVSALLVFSANDAAFNLAKHHPQGIDGFVKQMNLLIKKYNLKETNFVNVDGLQNENHYSTVYDLSQIGRIAIQNNIVKSTVKNQEITVSSIDGSVQHYLTSTDELLKTIPEIEGLKTGWTPEAKGCFVGLINLNGHYLISVVAQSDDRFQDTKNILEWAKQNVSW